MKRVYFAVWIFAACIGFAASSVSGAADPPSKFAGQFELALQREQTSIAADKRAAELATEAAKTESADTKARLVKEAADLRVVAKSALAEAKRIMTELAPIDRAGDGRAQGWLARRLYQFQRTSEGRLSPPSPNAILEAERRFIHALESNDYEAVTDAHLGLVRVYRDTNRIEEARRHLAEVASRRPEYRLTQAQWARQLIDTAPQWAKELNESNETVIANAQAAEVAFRKRLDGNHDDHEARFGLVECLLLQNKYEDAQAAINKGATLATQADLVRAYARKLCEVFVEWSDAKGKDPKASIADRFRLLDQAATLDPDSFEVCKRVMTLARLKGREVHEFREQFRRIEGRSSAFKHFLLGIDSRLEGADREAKYHWEKLNAMAGPTVAGNLALALATTPPEEPALALELVNMIEANQTTQPRLRGIQGLILLKMDRIKEAIPNLEAVLKPPTQDRILYGALSRACKKSGQKQLAEEFERIDNEMKEQELYRAWNGPGLGPLQINLNRRMIRGSRLGGS